MGLKGTIWNVIITIIMCINLKVMRNFIKRLSENRKSNCIADCFGTLLAINLQGILITRNQGTDCLIASERKSLPREFPCEGTILPLGVQ